MGANLVSQAAASVCKIFTSGMSADEIAASYDLNLAQVYAALTYYFEHAREIQEDIAASESLVAEMQAKYPSKLPR